MKKFIALLSFFFLFGFVACSSVPEGVYEGTKDGVKYRLELFQDKFFVSKIENEKIISGAQGNIDLVLTENDREYLSNVQNLKLLNDSKNFVDQNIEAKVLLVTYDEKDEISFYLDLYLDRNYNKLNDFNLPKLSYVDENKK